MPRNVSSCFAGRTDKGKVDDLEKPGWDFVAKDSPAVVLVVAMDHHQLCDELGSGSTHSRKRPRLQVL